MEALAWVEKLSGKKYSDPKTQAAFRVVADHIRSSTMLITDGVIPSNTDRGYVLRRIIRRLVRYADQIEADPDLARKLAEVVIEKYNKVYPKLDLNREKIFSELNKEEKELCNLSKSSDWQGLPSIDYRVEQGFMLCAIQRHIGSNGNSYAHACLTGQTKSGEIYLDCKKSLLDLKTMDYFVFPISYNGPILGQITMTRGICQELNH